MIAAEASGIARSPQDAPCEQFDVVIVGAGISGVGAGHHLTHECPGMSFVMLETQESFGGTWRTHRYPGVRSDSDLYTFGYRFKPWTGAPLASREQILTYIGEVIEDDGLDAHIRYRHSILSASWSSEDSKWTLQVSRSDGSELTISAKFLWMCQGYYRHSEGYLPAWEGLENYEGQLFHPQTWPEDIDLKNKNVVVIGSGATAATLIPAIAGECRHVTMLQRSPGYYRTGRNVNELADMLRALQVDEEWIHEIVRRKVLHDQHLMARRSFSEPEQLRSELLAGVSSHLGVDQELEPHFAPTYRPWSQRILFVPDGDLFHTIKSGKASVETDKIDRFTASGLLLCSGKELHADIIITATGFNLSVMGDIAFTVDGNPVNFAETVTYRGMMFTGIPNLVWVFGYFRASWTMRADLISDFVCRLLHHMNETGAACVTPTLRPEDHGMLLSSWISPDNFNPGYLSRSIHLLPKCGDRAPWQNNQDYWTEKDEFRSIDLTEASLVYGTPDLAPSDRAAKRVWRRRRRNQTS
jgi:cation diffusion facilitator CzcD-associated flavoprotein CzcO